MYPSRLRTRPEAQDPEIWSKTTARSLSAANCSAGDNNSGLAGNAEEEVADEDEEGEEDDEDVEDEDEENEERGGDAVLLCCGGYSECETVRSVGDDVSRCLSRRNSS